MQFFEVGALRAPELGGLVQSPHGISRELGGLDPEIWVADPGKFKSAGPAKYFFLGAQKKRSHIENPLFSPIILGIIYYNNMDSRVKTHSFQNLAFY